MNGLRALVGTTVTAGVLAVGLIAPGAAAAVDTRTLVKVQVGGGGFCGDPGEPPCDGVCINLHDVCILGSGG